VRHDEGQFGAGWSIEPVIEPKIWTQDRRKGSKGAPGPGRAGSQGEERGRVKRVWTPQDGRRSGEGIRR